MRWLSRFLKPNSAASFPAIASETPFYAVGDVHGCATHLEKLLTQLDPAVKRVYVGDYVDRGDESAAVLRMVMADQDATHLAGNHEAMMLKFINKPDTKSARWLRYGGLQTLASFGVSGVTETSADPALEKARDSLLDAMGPALHDWMEQLDVSYTNGNVTVVHAGADPREPIETQARNTLMWGHPDFKRIARSDGQWMLHGHTIVDSPTAKQGRIAIDTGAYATGRLTAAHVTSHGVTFLST